MYLEQQIELSKEIKFDIILSINRATGSNKDFYVSKDNSKTG